MARKETVVMIDDLTGDEAENVSTVEFAVDGVTYEVDLDEENAAEFRDFLSAYIEAGRRVGGRAKRGAGVKPSGGTRYNRETTRQIRTWARAEGFEVSDRGRVPNGVVEAWEQAHQSAAA